MSKDQESIPKHPALKPAEDYYYLRREGIRFIEQMGSLLWTDYNTHDPGITILENLCYAITDLASRANRDIKDILMPETPAPDPSIAFPGQAFFTARTILTVNPTTPDDLRRHLIDLEKVRNAWVVCTKCSCGTAYFAWCDKGTLRLSYQADAAAQPIKEVWPLGLYDILLELENDHVLGDLNDRTIEYPFILSHGDDRYPVLMEVRFPKIGLMNDAAWKLFLTRGPEAADAPDFSVQLVKLGATKAFNLYTDMQASNAGDDQDEYLRKHWQKVLYADFDVTFSYSSTGRHADTVTSTFRIENATVRLFSDAAARSAATAAYFMNLIAVARAGAHIVHRYRNKVKEAMSAVQHAKDKLLACRNLDEDYCGIRVIDVEDVAVCADVDVSGDADIERVQARIWHEIEQYFNPPVRFHTMQELMEEGVAVEEIFDGPELVSGFIKTAELEASSLRSVLRTSDIVNRLMKIDGVLAVNHLQLTKYDDEGNMVRGMADPTFVEGSGQPVFDKNKISASWLMYIGEQRQPRLYRNASSFLFLKNGLPFKPRMDEARDTLILLRGETERPKNKNEINDPPVPAGVNCRMDEYVPVQYAFPLTYGVGPEGLPSHASHERRARARQLKAYLMVFEQLLGNAFSQVANAGRLFSLDPGLQRTYFARKLGEPIIEGYDEIVTDLDDGSMGKLIETTQEFYERRNRFLDHIMARFGEQFSEHALLLTNLQGRQVALGCLVEDKISFIKAYPFISHDRAKASDYRIPSLQHDNQPGIKKRVSRLLGYPEIALVWVAIIDRGVDKFRLKFHLNSGTDVIMVGHITLSAGSEEAARTLGYRAVVQRMSCAANYKIAKKVIARAPDTFVLRLKGKITEAHGDGLEQFAAKKDAQMLLDKLVAWSSNERSVVVEHLLVRPKFPGDALYPVCSDSPCSICGEEDPYSFQMTFVMPGWAPPYDVHMEMRDFAERTIRRETPSHLVAKICWLGNEGYSKNRGAVISAVKEVLERKWTVEEGASPSAQELCDCAAGVYDAFGEVFRGWFESRKLDYIPSDVLRTELVTLFAEAVPASGIPCSSYLDPDAREEIVKIMINHYHNLALSGWQFDRFEEAWNTWLLVNGAIDWMEERLHERVEAILANNQKSSAAEEGADVCACAADILSRYGQQFYEWMRQNMQAGKRLQDFNTLQGFAPQIEVCGTLFEPAAAGYVRDLLQTRYAGYVEVSYRLWVVVSLLGGMSSIYPPATLHDWDEGSDVNPVRLGKTALGN